MRNAREQAEQYARALPKSHGWPPFLIVCDVGHCIELFADFSGQGKNYRQFPDRSSYKIFLEDLHKEKVRNTLKAIWLNPHGLDPTKRAATVTRDIAKRLAKVSKALEERGHEPQKVAHFLMRCLFTMFSEDVGLLERGSFTEVLHDAVENPKSFSPMLEDLWRVMDTGGFSSLLRTTVRRFNGSLFAEATAIPLEKEDIDELYQAAKHDWREVEPAIFGTLLEQALTADERRSLVSKSIHEPPLLPNWCFGSVTFSGTCAAVVTLVILYSRVLGILASWTLYSNQTLSVLWQTTQAQNFPTPGDRIGQRQTISLVIRPSLVAKTFASALVKFMPLLCGRRIRILTNPPTL